MITNKISYKSFEKAMFGLPDNYHMANAMTLDLLYSDIQKLKYCHYLTILLQNKEYRLTSEKIKGLIDALLDYQILYPLSDQLVTEILLLIERKMDNFKEISWIYNSYRIVQRAFSIQRFNHLLSIAYSFDEIPQFYIEPYLCTIKKYSKTAFYTYAQFPSFAEEKTGELLNAMSKMGFSEEYKVNCLKKIENYINFKNRETVSMGKKEIIK